MPHIYLIQEREFIKGGEPVFKIGKTDQTKCRRLNSYPKGSEIIMIIKVTDHHLAERELLESFKHQFTHRTDIGSEYFEGDWQEMSTIIFQWNLDHREQISQQDHEYRMACLELDKLKLTQEHEYKMELAKHGIIVQEEETVIGISIAVSQTCD